MKRIELFEFEDFNWLPKTIRTGVTNLIKVFHKLMGTEAVLTDLILQLKEKCDFQQIVDLGAGSGGPMLGVIDKVNEKQQQPIKLLLTDLYPNSEIVNAINSQNKATISYAENSVNAAKIGKAPKGLKTMIASFHHTNPNIARQILKSAEASKSPILIYELAKNNIPLLLWLLFLPLSLLILFVMSLVMTLFVRPLSFSQIFFTYLIPIIPMVYAWDGQASLMRTYTFKDVEELLGEQAEDYDWEIADAKKADGKKLGYYIMGYPKKKFLRKD